MEFGRFFILATERNPSRDVHDMYKLYEEVKGSGIRDDDEAMRAIKGYDLALRIPPDERRVPCLTSLAKISKH